MTIKENMKMFLLVNRESNILSSIYVHYLNANELINYKINYNHINVNNID